MKPLSAWFIGFASGAIACGGASGNVIDINVPDSADDGAAAMDLDVAAPPSDATTGDAGGGGPGRDAAHGLDAAHGADARNPGADATGPASDATSPGADAGGAEGGRDAGVTLPCGLASCAPGDTCCVQSTGLVQTSTCVTGPTCPSPTDVSLHCTSAATCAPTQSCCFAQTQSAAASECRAQCTGGQSQLCDPSAVDAGCPQGQQCQIQNSQQLPGNVGVCG
ncbi:MAG TPA: hypothetical protein VE987_09615 [Polyangiaceae bacterium]|nr:hypothetical protein [Polyangiaceae bacterium]